MNKENVTQTKELLYKNCLYFFQVHVLIALFWFQSVKNTSQKSVVLQTAEFSVLHATDMLPRSKLIVIENSAYLIHIVGCLTDYFCQNHSHLHIYDNNHHH
jgi:hypothetical protein